ncbi:MAG TPA: hypothetical protein VNA88_13930 [Candidatus Kapabacteria bacterium]|nr:hypothetical protein [Candidatus Kapabacteria bacterium]
MGTRLPQHTIGLALCLLFFVASSSALRAQFGDILGEVGKEALKGTSSLLEGEPPITTSLDDAKFADPTRDAFTPAPIRSLAELQRTPNGGFVLQPGAWAMQSQSYCLKAGTHGPGGGDGYLYAPPLGPADEIVMTIVRNSVNRPSIAQSSIQQLLWAIIARAKFEDLQTELKATASQLLTPRQLAELNRNALDLVPGPVLDEALDAVPAPLRAIYEAEAELRRMLTSSDGTFADMERVAVLAGAAPLGEGSVEVPSGRWSLHPDGYYVRYIPSGYSSTRVEIWVPQGSPAVGKEFDPATHIAVPGNTARQRLIQSGRVRSE